MQVTTLGGADFRTATVRSAGPMADLGVLAHQQKSLRKKSEE
jgi:hypothetical protein